MQRDQLVEPFIHGRDGKMYPRRPLPADDLAFLRGRAHYLRHDERLSVRQIVARFAAENGVRRSVGSIAAYLAAPCIACVQVAGSAASEHLAATGDVE